MTVVFKGLKRLSLATLVLAMLTACSESSFEDESKKIQRQAEQGNWSKSLILAKNLLRKTIDDGNEAQTLQTRIMLARSYYALGDYENALRFYATLEESTPGNTTTDDWHQALFLSFELDQPEFSEHIIKQLKPRLNNFELQIYNDKLNQQKRPLSLPDSVEVSSFAKLQLAYMVATNNIVLANNLFSQITAKSPEFAEAHLYKGRANQNTKNFDIALTSYIQFDQFKPIQPAVKLQIAAIAMQIGKPETARPYIEKLASLSPESPIVLQLQGILALHDNNFKEAKIFSEQSIGFGLDSHINRLIAGMSNFRLKQWEQSNTHLRWISHDLPQDHPARRMLIASKLALEEPELALQLLQEIKLNINDVSITTELAKQLIQKGQLNKAKQVQQRASKLRHFNEVIKKQHELLDMSIERQIIKQQLIENVANASADDQEKINLVLLHLSDGEFNNAHAIANRWYVESPQNIYAINSLASTEMAIGSKDQAAKLLKEALLVDEKNLPSLLFELQDIKENKNWPLLQSRAEEMLDILQLTQKNIFAYWLDALNQQSTLKLETVVPRLKENEEFELVFMSGLFTKRDHDMLNKYLYEHLKQTNWQHDHWLIAIELASREKKSQQTVQLINQYIADDKGLSTDQIEFIVKAAFAAQNYPLVLQIIETANAQSLDVTSSLVPRIISLLETNQKSGAKKLLAEQKTKTPEYYESVFEIERRNGNLNTARDALESSIIENPTLVKFAKLKSVAKTQQQNNKIKRLVTELASVSVDEAQIRASASQWFIAEDSDFAYFMLDTPKLEPLLQNNFVLANNFAWLLNERGEVARAKKYAQIALAAAPDNKQVIDTYNKVFGL